MDRGDPGERDQGAPRSSARGGGLATLLDQTDRTDSETRGDERAAAPDQELASADLGIAMNQSMLLDAPKSCVVGDARNVWV